MTLGIVILAAGQGTRMKSQLPKVLHPLAAKPLLQHVIDTALTLNPRKIIVVYGHGGEQVKATLADSPISWVAQAQQLGTGHAVSQAMPQVQGLDQILVLYGDVPLIRAETLRAFIEASESGLGILTTELDDPSGYGRIVRDINGDVLSIVEHKDADEDTLAICEINSGILCLNGEKLPGWLARIENDNRQGEYYLTDVVGLAVSDGIKVLGMDVTDPNEVMGVNDRQQLAELERHFQQKQAESLLQAGVSLSDPYRFDLRGQLTHGQDVSIDIGAILEGEVALGDNVKIGPYCQIRNCRIGPGCEILAHSVLENANIGPNCRIGPFARLRPGAELTGDNHIGNFVEIKQSHISQGSKINHLSYIGDSQIGSQVNIGAGTITCNYDGANKHRTEIGDRAFIGSNTALVAPVRVGEGATIGAGSVITKPTPDNELTLSRARQTSIPGWQRPQKSKR